MDEENTCLCGKPGVAKWHGNIMCIDCFKNASDMRDFNNYFPCFDIDDYDKFTNEDRIKK